jgi:hypothetical protein
MENTGALDYLTLPASNLQDFGVCAIFSAVQPPHDPLKKWDFPTFLFT